MTACILALTLLAQPLAAEERDDSVGEGLDLMERGAQILLRELMRGLEQPLRELGEQIGDLSGYHPPEMLPNGDIILRRRTPLRPEPDPETLPEEIPGDGPGEIEL